MTYSILLRDPETGALGGAAATGNLCVGAWVLRGRAGVGLSASQGHYPSTLWGETALDHMQRGAGATGAVSQTVQPDPGQGHRQLLALDAKGGSGIFTGAQNLPQVAECRQADLCAAGNMLSDAAVVSACADAVRAHQGSLLRRLLAGLNAGAAAGGDARGLMSAAILILSKDHPPIDLRIDCAPDPLGALTALSDRVEAAPYTDWVGDLPTATAPYGQRHE